MFEPLRLLALKPPSVRKSLISGHFSLPTSSHRGLVFLTVSTISKTLEIRYTRKGAVGSNPTASATFRETTCVVSSDHQQRHDFREKENRAFVILEERKIKKALARRFMF